MAEHDVRPSTLKCESRKARNNLCWLAGWSAETQCVPLECLDIKEEEGDTRRYLAKILLQKEEKKNDDEMKKNSSFRLLPDDDDDHHLLLLLDVDCESLAVVVSCLLPISL